jgi:site-specific DNA-methyltransferase (cytosine-N4-specific)
MIENIAFEDYKKSSDIHGTVLYPAVMVAPIQKEILRSLINPEEKMSIFDPFHGSGTALYECIEISNKVSLYGCDINPLANLITKVKLQGVTRGIYGDIKKLSEIIAEGEVKNPLSFYNIDKWFRPDIQIELNKIRNAIMQIKNQHNRLFFWCMFSDIVRRYSNSRSSTYKLHIKPEATIKAMDNKVVDNYLKSINDNVHKYFLSASKFCLYKCDILSRIIDFRDNQFNISITSPPYGENATTVPYGQFSILPLLWIDKNDLELEGWEFESYSSIDTNSIGGRAKPINMSNYAIRLIMPYLQRIGDSKQRKVIRFFNDYFFFLDELCRVTKNHIVLTLGNRTVDRVNIDLTNITVKYLENKGFRNEKILEREIPIKRIPRTTSRVGSKPVKSINSEYVIIHTKQLNHQYSRDENEVPASIFT